MFKLIEEVTHTRTNWSENFEVKRSKVKGQSHCRGKRDRRISSQPLGPHVLVSCGTACSFKFTLDVVADGSRKKFDFCCVFWSFADITSCQQSTSCCRRRRSSPSALSRHGDVISSICTRRPCFFGAWQRLPRGTVHHRRIGPQRHWLHFVENVRRSKQASTDLVDWQTITLPALTLTPLDTSIFLFVFWWNVTACNLFNNRSPSRVLCSYFGENAVTVTDPWISYKKESYRPFWAPLPTKKSNSQPLHSAHPFHCTYVMYVVCFDFYCFMYYFTCISFAIRPSSRKSAIELIDWLIDPNRTIFAIYVYGQLCSRNFEHAFC